MISIVRPIAGGSAPRIPPVPDFRRGWEPAPVVPVRVGAGCAEPAGREEGGDAGGTGASDSAGFDGVGFGAGEVRVGVGVRVG